MNTVDDVPKGIRTVIQINAIAAVSGAATTASMGLSELAGLGWNPFVVYGTIALAMAATAITVTYARKKG